MAPGRAFPDYCYPTCLNSALVYRHPWITFLLFFPTFLMLEAAAALAIYLYFVATAPSIHPTTPSETSLPTAHPGETSKLDSASVSGISSPAETEPATSATPSEYERVSDSEPEFEREPAGSDATARLKSQRRRERLRLGRGGVGMSAVSLGGGEVEAEIEGEGVSVSGGEEEFGFGVEEMEEVEDVVKVEGTDEDASTIAAVSPIGGLAFGLTCTVD